MSAAAGITTLYRSTIGRKVIMAVTGLAWIGFVFFHMYGNTKIFLGRSYFNEYAHGLRELGAPLFGHLHLLTLMRGALVVTLILHVWAAVTLAQKARAARPVQYAMHKSNTSTFASQYIRWGGIAILFFIIYHLAHFTWGFSALNADFMRDDPYSNVVNGFQSVPNVFIYLVAVTALGLHLYHGVWSMCQTLGLNNKNASPTIRLVALALGVLIPLGFAAVPLSILFGIVEL